PDGHDADALRQICLDKFTVSLGGGLGPLKGKLFRSGHLGDVNVAMVLGALGAIEISLEVAGVPHGRGGVQAAMEYLVSEA
ncbi:MAG: serine--glyoxylate aminotransferase, partial [Alphaproteobacteria bacterium]